ncbi:hypothetical protein M408DRAFT_329024 [Serendipita vermifera MAFF 305830]|uniref:Maintenance of telomere capping protein 1 n=1 Tax=Serendipita vermifera MAFF 305830 TaxID=933852 RepID=A0A0C3BC06_SERVB|nr:hypothetical protein M408DRAFT_329024 [Serendipita vermifera MAFF 305830]
MSKDNKDVLQFLDSLDDIPGAPAASKSSKPSATSGQAAAQPGEAAEALAFLNELTQQSSRPTRVLTPGPRVRNAPNNNASPTPSSVRSGTPANAPATVNTSNNGLTAAQAVSKNDGAVKADEPSGSGGGWGWGSVWTSASAALVQAKSVVEEQVKTLPSEPAKKWGEGVMTYVKQAQLDKLGNDIRAVGMSTLTQMMNAVAPPIAEHEVIQVWLSHDMKGYEGVESIVYRSLARIMEQVEGGDLVVNRGNESKPRTSTSSQTLTSKDRNLGAIDGLEPAYKLAVAELEGLVHSDILNAPKKEALKGTENPTTYSSVFLRIQPFFSITPPFMTPITKPNEESTAPARQLQFFLYLTDPNHSITHSTVSQVIPAEWLDSWDDYDWVEDLVVETLRVSVEVVGEMYLASRMGWGKKEKNAPVSEEKKEKEGGAAA